MKLLEHEYLALIVAAVFAVAALFIGWYFKMGVFA